MDVWAGPGLIGQGGLAANDCDLTACFLSLGGLAKCGRVQDSMGQGGSEGGEPYHRGDGGRV